MRRIALISLALVVGCGTKAASDGTPTDTTSGSTDATSAGDTTPSDTTPSDTAMGGDITAVCTGAPDGKCGICLKAHCDTEMAACVGSEWQTKEDPASVCAGLYAGMCKCQATASQDGGGNCGPGPIVGTLAAGCATCFDTLSKCLSGSCATDCN